MKNIGFVNLASILMQQWKWLLGLAIVFSAFFVTQGAPQTIDASAIVLTDNVSITYSDLCDGSIDSVNGHAPTGVSMATSHRLEVLGWLALSTEKGTVPAHKLVSLKGEDGDWIFREAKKIDRFDVGAHFGNSSLSAAGLVSTIDISNLQGHYDLSLAYRENDSILVCRKLSVPLELSGDDAPRVPTELKLSEQPVANCDGSIDSIDYVPPAKSISISAKQMNVSGWLLVKASRKKIPDFTYVILQSKSRETLFVETIPKNRPDVAQHFDNSGLSNSGYEVTIDLSSLEGEYVIGVAYHMNGETKICEEFAIPFSIGKSTSSH